ncbi:MAG TPA: hypothetical protein VFF00_07160 [Candidatus Elarobacter sp.]|nr:hypothetical protein [Dongiaceae bacterium]HZW53795.1 hypothetical protein [Candidatus Elarobacter sp.]
MSALPATASQLALGPDRLQQNQSYVFDFASEYGGGPVQEHGTLSLRRLDSLRVLVSGDNVRSGAGAGRDDGPPPPTTMPERVAVRSADGRIAARGERSRVADLIFDYDSLVTLLPRSGGELAVGTRWTATTRCWVSHTVSTGIPVTVVVTGRHGTTTELRASGAKRLTLVVEGRRVTTDAAVSVEMSFVRERLSRAVMRATQAYRRDGVPAGGGSYSWTATRTE